MRKESDWAGIRAMWAAHLELLICDATSEPRKIYCVAGNDTNHRGIIRDRARSKLFNGEHLEFVCTILNMSPDAIRDVVRKKIVELDNTPSATRKNTISKDPRSRPHRGARYRQGVFKFG